MTPPVTERSLSSYWLRRIILEQSMRAHVGHIASALSIVDIVVALYSNIMRIPSPGAADRDRFVLSKGHAALAVYAALYLKGWISEGELNSFCGDGTLLGVHPEHRLTGIDFSTGSLGQGFSNGAGAALAARMQKSSRRVFALMSDGECDEGSLWETVMFAAHHRLSNLVAIIDANGQQALGKTTDVLDLSPLSERWRAFGWDVREADGHDVSKLTETLAGLDFTAGPPHVVIAHTVSGKGVSYMEGKTKWHYWSMSEEEFRQALDELGAPS